MRDIYRFLLALLVAFLFLFPFPRRLVHNLFIGTLYVPVLRAEAALLDILHLRQERDYLLAQNAEMSMALGRKPFSVIGEGSVGLKTARPLRFDPAGVPQRITIDVGTTSGIGYGDVVMSGGALAGRVSEAEASTSLLITPFNRDFVAGVLDTRSHVLGTFKGGEKPVIDHIPHWEDVAAGDTLVTSGLSGFLPSGIPLAVVENVYRTDKPFLAINARPLYEPSRLRSFVIVGR